MTCYTADDILATLDKAAARFDLPGFSNRCRVLAPRLQAYRDDARWAIVFNLVLWDDGRLYTLVGPFGNTSALMTWQDCLDARPQVTGQGEAIAERMAAMADDLANFSPDAFMGLMAEGADPIMDLNQRYHAGELGTPTENDQYIETTRFDVDENYRVTAVEIRGQAVALERLQVEPICEREPELYETPDFDIALAVVAAHRDTLFATDEEIARFFEGGLPPPFLAVDAWEHIDLDPPSPLATFRQLAAALASGDASAYRPDPAGFNTDWRNWERL